MKKLSSILLIFTLLFNVACADNTRQLTMVTCVNVNNKHSFSTPWSPLAWVSSDGGTIFWGETNQVQHGKLRKMIDGEICSSKTKRVPILDK